MPSVVAPYGVRIVDTSDMVCGRAEMTCNDLSCFSSCDACHLDLDAEPLASHAPLPSVGALSATAEGATFFFFFSVGITSPERRAMNSRTPAGTVFPYRTSRALASSFSYGRIFLTEIHLEGGQFFFIKGDCNIGFFHYIPPMPSFGHSSSS